MEVIVASEKRETVSTLDSAHVFGSTTSESEQDGTG